MKIIARTDRLTLRELTNNDAVFINQVLNTPKFIKFIGDRGVRSVADAEEFIEKRFRQGYADHGYGLWAVDLGDGVTVGLCGFVWRESLPQPDLGFAFLPEFEGLGYGTESAQAALDYGQAELGFTKVLAITSVDNDTSGKLLEKLDFKYDSLIDSPEGEKLKLFEYIF